jgi:hypothetical protein
MTSQPGYSPRGLPGEDIVDNQRLDLASERGAGPRKTAIPRYWPAHNRNAWTIRASQSNWSARHELCQWRRETLDKERPWDEGRNISPSRW